jgi:hypothetical protein
MNQSDLKSYLRKVKLVKIAIASVALVMVTVITLLPLYNSHNKNINFFQDEKDVTVLKDAENPKIENPKFYGQDLKDQPYTIIADVGEQLDKDNIKLNNVSSDIVLKDGAKVVLTSKEAMIGVEKNILDLEGDIEIKVDAEYTIITVHVVIPKLR